MSLRKLFPFSNNTSSSKLNEEIPFVFDRGWSPEHGIDITTTPGSAYITLVDFIGGEGDKPFDPTLTNYWLGSTGYVTNINDAVAIPSGTSITTTYSSFDNGWTGLITVKNVGNVYYMDIYLNGSSATNDSVIDFSPVYTFASQGSPTKVNTGLTDITVALAMDGANLSCTGRGNADDIYVYYITAII